MERTTRTFGSPSYPFVSFLQQVLQILVVGDAFQLVLFAD